MDEHAYTVIERELGPDEQILWAGRPPGGLLLQPADLFLVPIALLWTGGMVAASAATLTIPGAVPMAALAALLAMAGLYPALGRFAVGAYLRRGTRYGVTSDRVLVVSRAFGRERVQSVWLALVPEVRLEERAGGGAVGFGPPRLWWSGEDDWAARRPPGAVWLVLGAEARDVFDAILSAQRAAYVPGGPPFDE